jgi:hypothetical protein
MIFLFHGKFQFNAKRMIKEEATLQCGIAITATKIVIKELL